MQHAMISTAHIRPGDSINARKHGRSLGVAELAASIAEHGLLNPIIVRAAGPDNYEIIDGNTRFQALRKIHGKKAVEVPVIIRDGHDPAAHEVSLVANIIRTPLHPVDEFEAFRRLLDDGSSVAAIAARFAKTEGEIRKRLQLAGLASEVRAAWRDGKIDADQAAAFASYPDLDRQRTILKRVIKAKNSWESDARSIRTDMMRDRVSKQDRRVRFVGLEAYASAGGRYAEDLFQDDVAIEDIDLLNRLAAEKIASISASLIAEGWAWAKSIDDLDCNLWDVPRLDLRPWMTPEEAEAYAKTKWEGERRRIAEPAMEKACADPVARSQSGVVVEIGYGGEATLSCLRLLPEAVADAESEEADEAADAGTADEATAPPPAPEAPRISQALREQLSGMTTKAMAQAIAADGFIALCAIVATLKSRFASYGDTPLRISIAPWGGHGTLDKTADGRWLEYFAKLLAKSPLEVIDEIRPIAATLTDFTEKKYDSSRGSDWPTVRPAMLDALAGASAPEVVREAFTAAFDPEAYFAAVSGATLDKDVIDMGFPAPKGKKAEKVAAAVAKARETGWLPPEMRTVHYVGPAKAEG